MWAASKRVTETPGNSWSRRAGAGLGKFVEDERRAGHLGEDGEQAGAGRRLQHEIARRERGRDAGDKAERDRRRELLKGLALLGAAGVRGQQRRELAEHGELRGGRDAHARGWPGRTCAGTAPARPRRRHRPASSSTRLRRRCRRRPAPWRRAARARRWRGRVSR